MVEILKTETLETEPLLAQFDEIEEWADYVALTLETAKRQPNNLTQRDQIAELAEEGFIDGRKLVLKIYRDEAERKAKAEEDAERRKQAISLGLDPDTPQWFVKIEAARQAAKAQAQPKPELKLAREEVAERAGAQPGPEPEPDATEEAESGEPVPQPGRALVPVSGEILLPTVAKALEQVELLNQKHAVIGNYGTKCAVLSWERWNINREVMMPTFQTFTDFRNRYMNRYVEKETEDGVKKVPAGKYWLSSPRRLGYESVSFEPGAPEVLPGNRLNLWRGFAVRPRQGCWDRMHDHIYVVLGAGDRLAGDYIKHWLAWAVQNPGLPAEAVLAPEAMKAQAKARWRGWCCAGLASMACRSLIKSISSGLSADTSNTAVLCSSMKHFGQATSRSRAD
jgi:hypothetical protein